MMWAKVRHSLDVGYDDKVVKCPKESETRGRYLMVEMRLMSQ